MVFVFWDKLFYLGYIGLATYHNPTIRLLQPVALLSFFCAVRVFTPLSNSWKVVLSSAIACHSFGADQAQLFAMSSCRLWG